MHDARNTFENNQKPPFGHPSPVFTDVYFYTDSQIDHQTGTLQRAPRQENRENLKHSTLHAVLRP